MLQRIKRRIHILIGKETDWSEHRKSYGTKNPDITFYVIRRSDRFAGVNSHFIFTLGHIRYAVRNGWIPIVDMQNYPNAFLEENEVGSRNAWEFYFRQPCDYSLEEVYQSKNVILSSGMPLQVYPNDSMEFFTRPELLEMWNGYYRKYLGFSEKLQTEIDLRFQEYFKGKINDRVLGVFLRGTDYLTLRPYEHPVQPSVEASIAKSKSVLEEQHCRWIYLVTEDQNILDAYIKEFGEFLIYIKEQPRYKQMLPGEHIAEHAFARENDKYLKGVDCLVQMGLLMRCNCFIAGRTSGAVATMVMQPQYDYAYFWNLGRYGIDDVLEID